MKAAASLRLFLIILILAVLAGCSAKKPPPPHVGPATLRPYSINGTTYYPIVTADGFWESGIASWYGGKFHGRKTACGETYDMYGMTAAHKILPMHSMLLVKNMENGREVVVRVNDRGPFIRGRIIDLSYSAAREIGIIRNGTASVEIIALGKTDSETKQAAWPGGLQHQDFHHGEYYVQIGSFLDRNNAEKIARSFLDRARVVIQPYITDEATFYRVQLYAGTSLETALLFEQQMLNSGYAGAVLIAR